MRKSSKTARKRTASLAGDLMLAPMVAMMRMPILAAEARNTGQWATESTRAVSEKAAAMAEGAVAAQMSLLQSAASFWPEFMSGRVPSMLSGSAVEHSVAAALRPASRRVRANFRRLSRS